MRLKKAQTSMEFVILTGFMLLAFLIFYVVIQSKLVEANQNSIDVAAKQVEIIVVNELKVAESVTDGYYREFELPQRINGINYSVAIVPGPSSGPRDIPEIVITYNGRERVYFISQVYISELSKIGKGLNNISKINGVILVQNMTS
jgi:uncharacterized protein (UPF0333 family)